MNREHDTIEEGHPGLESETRRPHALGERFDGTFLRNRTGVGPWDGLVLASEVFSELPNPEQERTV